jgi:hypothetical protein
MKGIWKIYLKFGTEEDRYEGRAHKQIPTFFINYIV